MLVRFSFNIGVNGIVRSIWLHYMYIFAVLYLTSLMRFSQNSGIMTPMSKYPGFQEGELCGRTTTQGREMDNFNNDQWPQGDQVRGQDGLRQGCCPSQSTCTLYEVLLWTEYVWDLLFLKRHFSFWMDSFLMNLCNFYLFLLRKLFVWTDYFQIALKSVIFE